MRQHVVADNSRDLDAAHTGLARGLDRGVRRAARIDAPGVGDDLGAAVDNERQRARKVRRKIARVAACFVALAVLLQDRECQLGERFEAEVVDTLGEQRVDGRGRVAVEALAARNPYGVSVMHARAGFGWPTAAPARAARRPGRARPRGTA